MNELSSNEVPQKFAEWLLAMGCHSDIVPSVDKVAEKCRGQYYMVWRSLMAKVEPKDVIKNKRPQVFYDDMRKAHKNNIFNERDSNKFGPEELHLWQKHSQLREKVAEIEARVKKEKEENLHQLAEKANSKLCQRYILQKRLQDRQRQALLLQKLANDLRDQKAKLLETKSIAESLCGVSEDTDIVSAVDKCLSSLTQQVTNKGASLLATGNSSTTIMYNTSDSSDEEVMSSLGRCRGDLLYKQLLDRRAELCTSLPAVFPQTTATTTRGVQSVVCHTASLHCTLALEAMKNKIHGERTREKLARAFLKLESYLSSDACELLVTRCEVSCSEARLASLRRSSEELAERSGVFATEPTPRVAAGDRTIHSVDKAIESKRDELKRLIASAAAIERKTQNVRERLLSLFNSFHYTGPERDRLGASSLPQDSITPMSTLRQFYEEKRESRKNKPNLSLNLDGSDSCSFNINNENRSPTFINELKLYLNKFSIENNRQIVLESGEKIWIFESTASSLHDLLEKWQNGDTTPILCPSVSLKHNLHRLLEDVRRKKELEAFQNSGIGRRNGREIDISSSKEEEQKILDRIKKRLNENMLSLVKTDKTLDIGLENLQLWSNNDVKKYISEQRKINGRTYGQYEKAYINSI